MRIDAHHHLWDLTIRAQDWMVAAEMGAIYRNFSMAALREQCAGTGIEKTILIQTVANPAETPELLAIADSDSMVAGVVGWLDLESESALDQLDSYLALPGGDKLVGIRDLAEYKENPRWLLEPRVVKNIQGLGSKNISFDLLTKPSQIPAAIELLKLCPQTQFIMDHLSKPVIAPLSLDRREMQPWLADMQELALAPNIFCKISGMVTQANWENWSAADFTPYFDALLNSFHPERLIFGSDWPVALLAASYKEVVTLAQTLTQALTPSEKEFFWSQSAINAYRLKL